MEDTTTVLGNGPVFCVCIIFFFTKISTKNSDMFFLSDFMQKLQQKNKNSYKHAAVFYDHFPASGGLSGLHSAHFK